MIRGKQFSKLMAVITAVMMLLGTMPILADAGEGLTPPITHIEKSGPERGANLSGAVGLATGMERGTNLPKATEHAHRHSQQASFHSGLIGFEGEYALTDDDSPVRVIVLFMSSPAPVQVAEAQLKGFTLNEAAAERIAEDDRSLFRAELDELFGIQARAGMAPYEITWEYRRALNGVSMTLPSNMVAAVAGFESVRAVYPDRMVTLDPPAVHTDRNPPGMAPGRATMGADTLHERGYRGAGVIIAVLDTGVDYYHPAFAGSFPTLEQMRERNPDITEADLRHGYFKGRDFVRDGREPNSPMETVGDTNHGTHVAGTIAGRDSGRETSILGVAPEALMIHYRVLGAGGTGWMSDVIMGIEQAAIDRPDVVNLSLGGDDYGGVATAPETLAVTNVMIANPDITFVISAGNAWDRYGITSPAASTLAITVGSADVWYVGNGEFDINLSEFSSRGPVQGSFEIKPDIIAHGSNVLSALPNWSSADGYGLMSGTSMASPHVAGAAALLIEYSRNNHGGAWCNEELKVRIMNNAIPMPGYGAVDVGGGYIDVFAAVNSDTVVFVHYDRVAVQPRAFWDNDFTTARTGSFSFGGARLSYTAFTGSLTASIVNNAATTRTYTLSHNFTNNPEGAAVLSLPSSVTVGPGEQSNFDAALTVQPIEGHGVFEGFVYVQYDSEVVARLPFAFTIPWPLIFQDVRLYRSVISGGLNAQNDAHSVLGIHFDLYFDENVWPTPEDMWDAGINMDFIIYQVVDDRLQEVLELPWGAAFRPQMIISILDLQLEEGDYILAIRSDLLAASPINDVRIPFSVDNTPPELNAYIVLPTAEQQAAGITDITVYGTVYDAWMADAAKRGVTFDIWEVVDPNGQYFTPYVDDDFLAVWVYATGLSPVRVSVSTGGSFEIVLPNAFREPMEIAVYAIDNFSLIPEHDSRWTARRGWEYFHWPGSSYFRPGGFLSDPRFPGFVWTGLNMSEYRRSVGEVELSFNLGGTPTAPTIPAYIAPVTLYPGALILDLLDTVGDITRGSYIFARWYMDTNFTNPITAATRMPAENATIFARWRQPGSVYTWQDLQREIAEAPSGTKTVITVQNDFGTATGAEIVIPYGRNILLTSAGNDAYVITQTNREQRHFVVHGKLTLRNIELHGPGLGGLAGGIYAIFGDLAIENGTRIAYCCGIIGGAIQMDGGTFDMEGGSIDNNSALWGDAIAMGYTAATMTGGTISNNAGEGIAVRVESLGVFHMLGGEISNNSGHGFQILDATFIMDDGTISNNGGSGVVVGSFFTTDSNFTMNGGTISGNTNNFDAGGVFLINYGSFTMIDGVISYNTSNDSIFGGGGVGVWNNSAFIMEGGIIRGNTAHVGGGVWVADNSTFTMIDGEISGNSATRCPYGFAPGNGGGVIITEDILPLMPPSTFNMSGGTIRDNTAVASGGGISISLTDLRNGRLTIGPNAVFSGNTANTAHERLPIDDAVYYEHIYATQWTGSFTQGFNNLDIQYTEGPLYTLPVVTRVTVNPPTANAQRGGRRAFTATVTGINNPDQTVTWTVEGSTDPETLIDEYGLLTVAADETAATLTVRATSAVDTRVSGTAAVTVGFGVVPPTGLPDLTAAKAAVLVFLALSAASWAYIMRRKFGKNDR